MIQVALGAVAEVIAGQSPEGKFYNGTGDGLPFYQGKKDFGEKFIDPATVWTSHTTKLAKAGDILMSVRAPVGPINFAMEDCCIGRGLAAIRCGDKIDRDFLFYQLLHLQPEISGNEGAVFASISKSQIEALQIVSPSIPEQHRIVAILDEALESIATAKANAEKSLRRSGDLVRGLTEQLFPQDGHSPGRHSLVELCEFIVDCEHKTAPTQRDGIPSIRTPNIGRGVLLLDGVNRVSEETYREWTRRAEPRPGDLILAREAPAGNVAVIPEGARVCLGQRTVLLRPRKDIFEPAYLAHLLLQRNSQRRLLAHSRGATVQHINVKDIRAFKVASVPPLEDQRSVVRQVDRLADEERTLTTLYTRKLDALDELKQSLLQQAFSGQL